MLISAASVRPVLERRTTLRFFFFLVKSESHRERYITRQGVAYFRNQSLCSSENPNKKNHLQKSKKVTLTQLRNLERILSIFVWYYAIRFRYHVSSTDMYKQSRASDNWHRTTSILPRSQTNTLTLFAKPSAGKNVFPVLQTLSSEIQRWHSFQNVAKYFCIWEERRQIWFGTSPATPLVRTISVLEWTGGRITQFAKPRLKRLLQPKLIIVGVHSAQRLGQRRKCRAIGMSLESVQNIVGELTALTVLPEGCAYPQLVNLNVLTSRY